MTLVPSTLARRSREDRLGVTLRPSILLTYVRGTPMRSPTSLWVNPFNCRRFRTLKAMRSRIESVCGIDSWLRMFSVCSASIAHSQSYGWRQRRQNIFGVANCTRSQRLQRSTSRPNCGARMVAIRRRPFPEICLEGWFGTSEVRSFLRTVQAGDAGGLSVSPVVGGLDGCNVRVA